MVAAGNPRTQPVFAGLYGGGLICGRIKLDAFGSLLEERYGRLVKTALITGVAGQDGTYLSRLLLAKDYRVFGLTRLSPGDAAALGRLDGRVTNFEADLTDSSGLTRVIQEVKPDEIYHLAAQTHVQASFSCPEYTANADALGTLRILDAIRVLGRAKETRFLNAATGELYGRAQESPQTETTPFYPRSPYAVAKLFSFWATVNYRESYGLHAANAILFNHESPLRSESFVTRKITKAAARIKLGLQKKVSLGNLDSRRDWGFAGDYVEAMWLMLQQAAGDDYVIATGHSHTVRDFCQAAFAAAEIDLSWRGSGVGERGVEAGSGRVVVEVAPEFFRPIEAEALVGDASKARSELGWEPRTSFKELVKTMVEADLSQSSSTAQLP